MSRNSEKKSSRLWGEPDDDHKPRHKRKLENPDIFFTLKVYSQASGRKNRSLKFTVDFNPPFEPNVQDIEPYYVSTRDKENVLLFKEILEHVGEVYRYISDPVNYQPEDGKAIELTREGSDRRLQQDRLKQILDLTEGRINSFFYAQSSANMVGVSAVALSDGDGDPRPPRKP